MADFIPNRKPDIKNDDIQDIDGNIIRLAQKYILPIDAIRSIARPKLSSSKNADECVFDVEIDHSRPLESRAHAFLRFVGFPVAVKPDSFYNPGFDPTGALEKTKRADINNDFFDSNIKPLIDRREEIPENNRSVFARQDLSSSVYSLLLTSLIRPFVVLEDGVDALDIDKQQFSIKDRQKIVDDFFNINSNLNKSDISFLEELLGPNFTDGAHILKPFVVDPSIDAMAMPAKNRIAVPFLPNKDSLKIDQNTSVSRPGLELIIRERLRASEAVDTVFLETVRQILDNDISPNQFINSSSGTLDGQDLINTVAVLLGDYDIETSEIEELKNITAVQTRIISQLVRTLKKMIDVLHESIQTILKARQQINWIPIPNADGPELGSKNARLNELKISSKLNEIDRIIIKLTCKKITAEHQITQISDLGPFASPFNVTTNDESLNKINDELNDATERRDRIANDAFEAMGNIELIMGEVSGLGLVDIISVYIALWAMDEEALISLLDNESFNRLTTNFPDLIVGAAANRKDSGKPSKDIVTALNDFESKLKNVLNFAQIEFSRRFVTAGEEASGDIYADQ